MTNTPILRHLKNLALIVVGCALFALGFDLFLQPNQMNAGGISGIAQLLEHLLGVGSVAFWSVAINVPLFLMSIRGVGRGFFVGSLIGMLAMNLFIELFLLLPVPQTEPLLAALYGGLLCGAGCGLVFISGASSGGVDILARLLGPKFPAMPIGKLILVMDIITVSLTGLVFGDVNKAL